MKTSSANLLQNLSREEAPADESEEGVEIDLSNLDETTADQILFAARAAGVKVKRVFSTTSRCSTARRKAEHAAKDHHEAAEMREVWGGA